MRPAKPKYQLWHIMIGIAVLGAVFSRNEVVYGIAMVVAIAAVFVEWFSSRSPRG